MYANIYISNGMLISIYHNLKAYFVSLGERFIKTKFAYPFIFLMGLVEAIIFPFPQEIFMVPMMALDKKKIFKIAGLSVLGSITGAIIAYFIGVYFFNSVGNFILQNLNLVESFNSFVNDIDNYGFLYVFIGGFTPIPFKIVTLTSGFLGINVGPNKETQNKEEDYYVCLSRLGTHAGYLTINISSPNTEGLRDFHNHKELEKLLKGISKIKKDENLTKPIVVKLSPDINDNEISNILELINKYGVNGIIVSNTTDSNRENLTDSKKSEVGGLSGQPLRDLSTKLIKRFYKETKGKIQIIGVGGVDSAKSAYEKILSGATLVQLYTGMVYRGPRIAAQINNGLIKILEQEGINNINDVVGLKKST